MPDLVVEGTARAVLVRSRSSAVTGVPNLIQSTFIAPPPGAMVQTNQRSNQLHRSAPSVSGGPPLERRLPPGLPEGWDQPCPVLRIRRAEVVQAVGHAPDTGLRRRRSRRGRWLAELEPTRSRRTL